MCCVREYLCEKWVEKEKFKKRKKGNASLNRSASHIRSLGGERESRAYWFLNISRGGSRGCEDNARSGLRDVINDPIVFANVGIESSEISWYALRMASSE